MVVLSISVTFAPYDDCQSDGRPFGCDDPAGDGGAKI